MILLKPGFCATDEKVEERLKLNPLYSYAAQNWGYHAREALKEVIQLILDLLKSETKVSGCSQAMMAYEGCSSYSEVPKRMTQVHLVAYFGLNEAMAALLSGHDLNSKNNYGRTPLSYAVENGHEAVVKLLLEKGADLESQDQYDGRTLLLWAAKNGHEAVVKLLLEKGAELESMDMDGWTLLLWAAKRGNKAAVKLLLEKGASLESKDMKYGPLWWAVMNVHVAVVKLLLEKDGIDVDFKDAEYN